MQKKETIVKCENVLKTFKTSESEVIAVNQVNLEVFKGEFFMIVGPSGCGKTTLISIIAGILQQDDGNCIILDVNLKNIDRHQLLEFRLKNIGFIFQSFNLIPTLSVVENVAIPLIIQGVQYDDAINRSLNILSKVNLKDKAQVLPNLLSGGQQQRVAIARSLVHKPKLIICDEPTSALDHANGIAILELMKEINKEFGTTFVIVTHDSRIFSYADRIIYMNDGKVEKILSNTEYLSEKQNNTSH